MKIKLKIKNGTKRYLELRWPLYRTYYNDYSTKKHFIFQWPWQIWVAPNVYVVETDHSTHLAPNHSSFSIGLDN